MQTKAALRRLGVPVECQVRPELVEFLGMHAFQRVLSRKRAKWAPVVAMLERALEHPMRREVRRDALVQEVVRPEKSDLFHKIAF